MEIIRTCGAGDLSQYIASNRELHLELIWLGIGGAVPSCTTANEQELVARLNGAIADSDIIILTGGMGQEADFSTLLAVCRGLHLRPKLSESAMESLRQYCKKTDTELTEEIKHCAWLPEGSLHIPNPNGCEQGAVIDAGEQCIILLPSDTQQAGLMLRENIIEYLCKFTGLQPREIPAVADEDEPQKFPHKRQRQITAAILVSFFAVALLPVILYSLSHREMGKGQEVIKASVQIFSSLPPQEEDITGGAAIPQEESSSSQSESSGASSQSKDTSSSQSQSLSQSSSQQPSSSQPQKPDEKPETSSKPSSQPQQPSESSEKPKPPSSSEAPPPTSEGKTLRVSVGGRTIEDTAFNILCGVVQSEMGGSMHTEALKAQAVAAYSYISYENSIGRTPSVGLRESVSTSTRNAVNAVLGQAVHFNGSIAYTTYHATSAGMTNSSRDVWGGSFPYLIPVDSSVDQNVSKYSVTNEFSSQHIADRAKSSLGITLSGDPSTWLEVISLNDSGYVSQIRVGSTTITGRSFREQVMAFALRSHSFDVDFDSASGKFSITTRGYGHGVGMSQTGANEYAKKGWSYKEILEHYFPGTSVK